MNRAMKRTMGAFWGLVGALLLSSSAWAQGQVVEYYHLDALGTVRAVTDEVGTVLERHDYLPFGEELCGTVVCGSSPGGQSKRFTGKERDAETGLDYYGARYYRANVGRFTTIDPVYTWQENLVDPQRWNRYAYVRNNPLKYTDSDGRAIDTIADIVFIAYDLIEIGVTRFTGGEVTRTQRAALGADLAAAAIPFATGAGIAVRAASRAEHAAEATRASQLIKEGIYEFPDALSAGKKYIGQSSNLPKRLGQHEKTGKKAADAIAEATAVPGGKTAREAAEQRRINQLGGTRDVAGSQTSNVRNPIGPGRRAEVEKKHGPLDR